MDNRMKLFVACASAVLLAVAVGAVVQYVFGAPKDVAVVAAFATAFTVAATVAAAAFAVAVASAFATAFAVAVASAFATAFTVAAKEYGIPFWRAVGCLLGESAGIGFWLYYLPDLAYAAGAVSAGILLMLAALYTPCPHWPRCSTRAEEKEAR